MKDLIEKLEKATGPDREIDASIALVAGFKEINHRVYRHPDGTYFGAAPYFTKSIDDARRLILPGHSFGGLAQVSPNDWLMMIFSRIDSRARWEGEAPTAELAICIAALKARLTADHA